MSSTPAFLSVPAMSSGLAIVNATGTTFVDLLPAISNPNGVVVGSIRATSSDTAAQTLQFSRKISGTDYVIGEAQVPSGSGTNGSVSYVDVLSSLNGGVPMTLAPGETLRVRSKTAVTNGSYAIHTVLEAAPL